MTDNNVPAHLNTSPKMYYGYVIVGLAFLIMIGAQGPFNSFGVFFNPLREQFDWTHAVTSGAFSLSMIVRGIMGILMGGLTDRFGPRLVLVICGVLLGAGFLLMSRVEELWQFYLYYAVIIGVGMSGIWVPLLSSVARWFERRRSLMTSLVVTGVGLGGFLVPPLLNRLIEATDWRAAYLIVAGVVSVSVIGAGLFFRRPSATELLRDKIERSSQAAVPVTASLTLAEAFRTKQLWMVLAVFFASGYFSFSMVVHLVPYAEHLGVTAMNASTLLGTMNGVSLLGILVLAGMFGDRLGSRMVFQIAFILVTAALVVLMFASELWMLYLGAIPFGIALGSLGAAESPLVARMFGMRSHGVIFGIAGVGFTSGTAAGPFLTGLLFDVTGSYLVSLIVCAVAAVAGLAIIGFLRPIEKQ